MVERGERGERAAVAALRADGCQRPGETVSSALRSSGGSKCKQEELLFE